ncbi:hypothetical protein [Candidatus Lokiarchaeum ossiferum]|uniref:hypothetical protein n=1 Tax=Candidatus Lokiarchaeum ossiferum TaxID=2951803 RepID=UPI00352FD625
MEVIHFYSNFFLDKVKRLISLKGKGVIKEIGILLRENIFMSKKRILLIGPNKVKTEDFFRNLFGLEFSHVFPRPLEEKIILPTKLMSDSNSIFFPLLIHICDTPLILDFEEKIIINTFEDCVYFDTISGIYNSENKYLNFLLKSNKLDNVLILLNHQEGKEIEITDEKKRSMKYPIYVYKEERENLCEEINEKILLNFS